MMVYIMIMENYLSDGFKNERLIVIPEKIKDQFSLEPLIRKLYITDIGFFPSANHHRRKRAEGAKEHIAIYCMKGTGWVQTSEGRITVGEKELIVIKAGYSHSYGASSKDPWSIYWFHFIGDDSKHYLEDEDKPLFQIKLNLEREIHFIDLFDRIFFNLLNGYNRRNMIIVSQLFAYLLSSLIFSTAIGIDRSEKTVEVIEMSIENMRQNLESRLTLPEMAAHVNYSIPHFSSLFKKKTGHSPLHYYLQLKIQRACLLLDTTRDNIGEISRKLGMDDPYYFSRMFRKIIGISPKNYRNIKKG